jgi:chromosomal replication initiator protein
MSEHSDRYPMVGAIIVVVAQHYKVTPLEIKSSRRTDNIVRPRQVAMYLARTSTLKSLPQIGQVFGNRDHTTVIHAVRKIGRLIRTDADLAHDVAHIEQEIGSAS